MNSPKNALDDLRIHRPAETRRAIPAGPIIALVVLVVLAAGVVWWLRQPRAIEAQTFTVRAEAGSSQTVLNASGYVTARREATVSSKVTGKVLEVLVEEGMKVTQGQILARLDSTNIQAEVNLFQAQLDAAQTALGETQARLQEARLELNRVKSLAASNIARQADLDRAQADFTSWEARLLRQQSEVEVARKQLAVWQQQLQDTIITAPFSGVVVSKNAQPGEMISPVSAGGGFTRTGICTIVDMESLEIEIDVNESFINRVQPGQKVEAVLDAYPDWRIPAKVIAIIPTADRQKATVKVRVGFEKLEARILPQMGVKVAFQAAPGEGAPARAGISIPREALRSKDGKEVVYVARNGRVEQRAVRAGLERSGQVAIEAGLASGEKIIVSSKGEIQDGAAVKEIAR